MIVGDRGAARQRVERLFEQAAEVAAGDLGHVAAAIAPSRASLLALAGQHPTPFYAFDGPGFSAALARFKRAFDERLPGHRPFYAMKSNHHRLVVEAAASAGFGLDVSSGRELAFALEQTRAPIVFTGPAKSIADLELAVQNADRVTLSLDSFGELARLGEVTRRHGRALRAAVRVSTEHHGAWSKFGIPLASLGRFWREAAAHPLVRLEGVHFHLSWNRDAEPYARIIDDLSRCLAADLTASQRGALSFVDIGGGYRPHRLEGYFPADHPLGAVIAAADAALGHESDFVDRYYEKPSITVEAYAEAIGEAVDRHLAPLLPGCSYLTEPGRIVSTYAMHLVLRVVDKKSDDLVIVDGGINMVGWEKYLQIYCPVVSLTRPAEREIGVRLGGSLCDCEDVWGRWCFAQAIDEGDVLVVPYQGAYSISTAQAFIRDIPPVHALGGEAGG